MAWSGKDALDRLREMRLPDLTREAEIPVYLIHNSDDPEDYFFLFDFEEFVARSDAGLFVRPSLRVFAGRDDFSRARFARQFREVFAEEFDRMRAELANKGKGRGWLDWNVGTAIDLLSGLVANLVLAVALRVGRSILGNLSLPSFLKGKSAEAKLHDEIERTKGGVEEALARIDITVHPELLAHAERRGGRMKRADLDRDAWPLPSFVRAHLDDGESGSWW